MRNLLEVLEKQNRTAAVVDQMLKLFAVKGGSAVIHVILNSQETMTSQILAAGLTPAETAKELGNLNLQLSEILSALASDCLLTYDHV
jgi:hypothetical protein